MNLCIPTLNRYDMLDELLSSVYNEEHTPPYVYIIDNGKYLDKQYLSNKYDGMKITFYTPSYNLGVAASWNWFLQNVKHPMVISNDDIKFSPNALDKFFSHYYKDIEYGLYYINNSGINKFSCFIPTEELVSEVGYFDETFYPAYFEDNDYQYRMKLSGIKELGVDISVSHFGSATIKSYNDDRIHQHHLEFNKNKEYYIKKWGGLPGNECNLTPFGE